VRVVLAIAGETSVLTRFQISQGSSDDLHPRVGAIALAAT
jgi:hypothetical protein